jgi:hypothetical protein
MAQPDGGLIQETNAQYYAGSQTFIATATQKNFTTTFNTELIFGSANTLSPDYAKNNFKIYTSATGEGSTYNELTIDYTVSGNTITLPATLPAGTYVTVQLKRLDGGHYGSGDAYGNTVEENYGSYAYIKVSDLVTNFTVAYVGPGKLIPNVKRTDIIFHAKRALQELSYDTLNAIKSQEVEIPPGLSIPLPQDYVNYVNLSWVDQLGVKHVIYPTTLTSNPTEILPQDYTGQPVQDDFDNNITATSIIEKRWDKANDRLITGAFQGMERDESIYYDYQFPDALLGRRYGMEPEISQTNGWFTVNQRENSISFSSNLNKALIIFEYISDGLGYDQNMRVPKMAEAAVYAHINHAILSSKINTPEYIVNRYKKEKFAETRNAKIRLSNIKPKEFVQVMRGKSKWLKN